MASFDEAKRAILRLQDEKPAVFNEFCRQFPEWESWKRAPYGARRTDLEQFLFENGVLERALVGSHTRDKRFEVVQFPIKIPSDSPSTLAGAEFLRKFTGTFYLFRRAGRSFGMRPPIFISKIDFNLKESLNYIETREGSDRTSAFRQQGMAYLTQGSLVFLAVDELGHPSLASFAHVNPEQIKTHPILDGHLLASTLNPPSNANFVVRAMLVHAVDREASTGVFTEDDKAIAEFQKLKPPSWKEEWWDSAFSERFNATDFVRWDGNYYETFTTHQQFEA